MSGGWGFTAYGRDQYGNVNRDDYSPPVPYNIEPRFSLSVPVDNATNVALTQALKFEVYSFRSYIDLSNIAVTISEDGGTTYATAYIYPTSYAPYSVRFARPDGQRLWVYVTKSTNWSYQKEIVIRFTGHDEFNQQASKTTPVKWS